MSKKSSQKIMAIALVSSFLITQGTAVNTYAFDNRMDLVSLSNYDNENVVILNSYGDLETASVEWQGVEDASGYNVYYKKIGEANSKYRQLDSELIRQYSTYFRADVLGIEDGSYVIKVVPLFDGKESTLKSAVTSSIDVKSHTREGFAFSKDSMMGTASGGYNDDGTVAEDATILYVTSDNINTIQADVITNSKGSKTTCTGLVDILTKRQKGYDQSHLIIRVIGEIKGSDIAGINSSGYIQLKGLYNTTLEGVGEDATVNGWGILVRGSRNVEIRNLGIMLFPDDAISLDTDNENIWIHNNDIFYGAAGSDADQAKGDGSADVKGKSTNVTISHNHFWDSGKSSLCGMSDSEEFFVTYHHNWFDHSDSRHPRIRVGTIHIYNNYFDGNSKYGVGVTKGASAFVEANEFRNSKYPMLSSLQGSDVAGNSKGTFSGEAGGMIKAYNNSITGGKDVVYAQDDAVQFDAYLAVSKDEVVPASYKTVSGGTTYNNFDTSSKMYEYKADDVNAVVDNVTAFAGRVNGGDFAWTFTSEDDPSSSVNKVLMEKILNYKSEIVSIGGNSVVVTPDDGDNSETPEVPSEPETPVIPDIPETSKVTVQNFTEYGKDSSYFIIQGKLGADKTGISYSGLLLTDYLKIETSTSISFATDSISTLTLVLNSDFSKYILVDGVKYKANEGLITVELEAGDHTITKGDAAKLYYMSVEE
ncbi:pectate lyase [Lysinibacillus contaminans]|uniref:Pectate lyase n=2 Tax=Lysinibacillus contaminans TaxID=1293441 RepID=A0ABR5K4B1_9BACI|nr:pectate lyase [Lysinibacillus contaminans]